MVPTLSARQLALSAVACLGVALSPGSSFAQDSDAAPSLSDQYTAVLQEIADRRTTLAQREFYVAQQQAQIDALNEQLTAAGEADASAELLPIVQEMVAELERVMVSDLPFRVERRFALLDDLRADIQAENPAIADAFRRAMELYGQEVTYGYQVGSYTGQNPITERQGRRFAACEQDIDSPVCDISTEQRRALTGGAELSDLREQLYDGNYIHYGRMALLYLERDSSEGYRYNPASSEWEQLSNADLLGLRQNVRIARGESAIGTMTAPIVVGEAGADAS